MNIQRAVTAVATIDGVGVRRAYRRAIRHGRSNTQCSPEEETAYGTLRLLTLATLRLPDLALYAHLLHACGDDDADEDSGPLPRPIVRGLSDVAAGAMRLAHRALETHANRVHYEVDAWLARTFEQASAQLDVIGADQDAVPIMVEQTRRATVALTRATAATAHDPMLVPEQVAAAQAHLLAVYLIATEAACT